MHQIFVSIKNHWIRLCVGCNAVLKEVFTKLDEICREFDSLKFKKHGRFFDVSDKIKHEKMKINVIYFIWKILY